MVPGGDEVTLDLEADELGGLDGNQVTGLFGEEVVYFYEIFILLLVLILLNEVETSIIRRKCHISDDPLSKITHICNTILLIAIQLQIPLYSIIATRYQ